MVIIMRILFDSKNSEYKKPFGCLRKDEKCTLNIHIPDSCNTQTVCVHLERDDGFEADFPLHEAKRYDCYTVFSGTFSLNECGLYFYRFDITTDNSSFKLMKYGDSDTNIEDGTMWQITCIPRDYKTPDDFKGRVIYQIFPDRFNKCGECDTYDKLTPYYMHASTSEAPAYLPDENGKILNNDFYGGNLKGITQKLPYLKDLGVGIIYLNPIFKAYSNHRYDTCDYRKIDPMLGTEEDFTQLCDEAHKCGIKIILDGVFSHTGCDSIYFDKYNHFGGGAFSNPDSPYRNWYSFSEYPNKYDSWWGIDTLPCTNELNEDYIKYIITDDNSVIRHWLRAGADGFRLDVADELPDEFIKLLRDTVKAEKSTAAIYGEVWEDASNKTAYDVRRKYFSNAELDSVMNYPFRNAVINLVKGLITSEVFASEIMTIVENYPDEVLHCLMNSLSTHDTERIFTNLSGADLEMPKSEKVCYIYSDCEIKTAISRIKTAVFLQFFLPGSPCIYYGDEIGMKGFNDPFNRCFFDYRNINREIFDFYGCMTSLKNSSNALKYGDIHFNEYKNGILRMERSFKNDKITAAVNLSDSAFKITADTVFISHNVTNLGNNAYVQNGGFILYS